MNKKGVMEEKPWLKYVPENVYIYNACGHSLDGKYELIQECLSNNNTDGLCDMACDILQDGLEYIMSEIYKNMVDDDERELFSQCGDDIEEELWKRDKSTPKEDLVGNTSDMDFFYSTGINVEENPSSRTKEKVRKMLGLKKGEFKEELKELFENATYGGELRIYFRSSLDKLITCDEEDFKYVRFNGGVVVAIANSDNGSGFDVTLPLDITFEFERGNLYLDDAVRWSYAKDICGMGYDWCMSTNYKFGKEKIDGTKVRPSKMTELINREKRFDGIFASGGCCVEDNKISRHQDVTYRNSYPAGNKCERCGKFWID